MEKKVFWNNFWQSRVSDEEMEKDNFLAPARFDKNYFTQESE